MSADFTATGLHKSYGVREVLCGIDLSVAPGEIVGLLGPSGSGKSTVFEILTGVEKPDRGTVTLRGETLNDLGVDARARRGIGYVPQSPDLFARLSVEDNLRIAADTRLAWDERAADFVGRIVGGFGLEEVRAKPVGTLSGGQRRLVEIAFAVCTLPKFLLLDEPFSGLDPIVVERIVARLRALAKAGIGVLVTDHKAHVALELVHRAVVIEAGLVVASGPPAEVARDRRVREVFLGESYRV
ncbi:MAG: ATP-binding cassette domain-containing protein [Siculibacillus sp.]